MLIYTHAGIQLKKTHTEPTISEQDTRGACSSKVDAIYPGQI